MGSGIAHVEQRQQPRRVPGRARGQLVTLDQQGLPSGFRQVVGNCVSDRPAPDNQSFDMRFHQATPWCANFPIHAPRRGQTPRPPDLCQQKTTCRGAALRAVDRNGAVLPRLQRGAFRPPHPLEDICASEKGSGGAYPTRQREDGEDRGGNRHDAGAGGGIEGQGKAQPAKGCASADQDGQRRHGFGASA